MSRLKRPALWLSAGAVVLFVLLASHQSMRPQVLGRYSLTYFAVLVAYALGLASALLLYRHRHRWDLPAVADRFGAARPGAFADASFSKLVTGVHLLHGVLVCLYLSPLHVFSAEPILRMDYAHHFHQVSSVIESLSTAGRSWALDPSFCAGYPVGTLFDVDMKLFEVLAYVLVRAGFDLAFAFNGLIFLCFLSAPTLLFCTCRNIGFSRAGTVAVLLTGVLLWHSHRLILSFNSAGMLMFVFGTYWALWTASVLHRYLRRPRASTCVVLTVALAIGFAAHITMPVLLAGPLMFLYLYGFKRITWRHHALLAVAVAVAVAVNSWWIAVVMRFMSQRVNTLFFEAPRISEFLASILDFESPDLILGGLGLWGFAVLRPRIGAIGVMGLAAIPYFYILAHFSRGIPWLNTLEVGRFAIPFAVLSMMGLAAGVMEKIEQRSLAELTARSGVPVLLVVFFFAGQVMTPRSVLDDGFASGRTAFAPLVEWFENHTSPDARIAFLDTSSSPLSGAKLRYYLDRELIGGPFWQMNLEHSYASFTPYRFFDVPLAEVTVEDLTRYSDRFNIKWLVTVSDESCGVFRALEPVATLVERLEIVGKTQDTGGAFSPFKRFWRARMGLRFCVFEIDRPASFFLEGAGEVTAGLNRIEVRGASAGRVVLKYHWLETLAADPPLPLSEYRIEGQPIGFIEVENGEVQDFVIYNSYRW